MKRFAVFTHPARRAFGGLGRVQQRKSPHHSPPQRRKGVQRDKSLWRCPRRTARRAGEPSGKI